MYGHPRSFMILVPMSFGIVWFALTESREALRLVGGAS